MLVKPSRPEDSDHFTQDLWVTMLHLVTAGIRRQSASRATRKAS